MSRRGGRVSVLTKQRAYHLQVSVQVVADDTEENAFQGFVGVPVGMRTQEIGLVVVWASVVHAFERGFREHAVGYGDSLERVRCVWVFGAFAARTLRTRQNERGKGTNSGWHALLRER